MRSTSVVMRGRASPGRGTSVEGYFLAGKLVVRHQIADLQAFEQAMVYIDREDEHILFA